MKERKKVIYFLFIGLLATSFPAIFVRFTEASPLSISFYRNFLASLFMFPFALKHLLRSRVYKALFQDVLLASFFLALHFYSWNTSLKFTSVASSLFIVATQPVWSAIFGFLILKEKVSLRGVIAILLALSGIFFITILDFNKKGDNIYGDLLALIAAIFASLYLITGRRVRHKIPLALWLFFLYFFSSMILLIISILIKEELKGFPLKTYIMFFLMALIPSFIGHSILNYAVRFIEAYKVQLGLLLEPFISTYLAFIFFEEIPPFLFYPAAFLSICGVLMGIFEIKERKEKISPHARKRPEIEKIKGNF